MSKSFAIFLRKCLCILSRYKYLLWHAFQHPSIRDDLITQLKFIEINYSFDIWTSFLNGQLGWFTLQLMLSRNSRWNLIFIINELIQYTITFFMTVNLSNIRCTVVILNIVTIVYTGYPKRKRTHLKLNNLKTVKNRKALFVRISLEKQ